MSTFVSVGNATQGFPRLLNAVASLAPKLPQPVIVQSGANSFVCAACQSIAFLEMESFMRHMQEAELLILHAGAGSIINAIQIGKVPVVAPRRACYGEHVDDHQVDFARILETAGRVVLVEDMQHLAPAVEQARLRQSLHLTSGRPSLLISMVANLLSTYAKEYHE